MLKKALSGLDRLHKPGLPGLTEPPVGKAATDSKETGIWSYLVTDLSGIRPRQEPVYSTSKESSAKRYPAGTVVEVHERLRSGWTKWLRLAEGGWLFDISPKDRKVRMVEVEVQHGLWKFEVCTRELVHLAAPNLAKKAPAPPMHAGEVFSSDQKVRPRIGRGAFLRVLDAGTWVCDFMDGNQLVRRCEDVAEEPISPLLIQADLDDRQLDDDAEVGEWKYIVLDPKGVTLRSRPTYDKAAKLKARLEEGEVVEVLERQEGADTVFLRVEGPDGSTGWVFTTQPGPAPFLRLLEVEVKKCSLYFQVLATRGCPLRSRCSLVDAAKVGKAEAGQLLRVVGRLEVGGTRCFGLESGEWVVCPKDLEPSLKGPLEVRKMNNEEAEVQAEESVMLRKEPTDLPWAATKKVLLPKSKVLAIRRAHLQGEMWMEVMQLGGMSGWMPASDLQLEFSVSDLPRRSR